MFFVPNIPHIRNRSHYKDKRWVRPNARMSSWPTVTNCPGTRWTHGDGAADSMAREMPSSAGCARALRPRHAAFLIEIPQPGSVPMGAVEPDEQAQGVSPEFVPYCSPNSSNTPSIAPLSPGFSCSSSGPRNLLAGSTANTMRPQWWGSSRASVGSSAVPVAPRFDQ